MNFSDALAIAYQGLNNILEILLVDENETTNGQSDKVTVQVEYIEKSNKEILDNLPKPNIIENEDDQSEEPCAICMDCFKDQDDIREGRNCHHQFHFHCLKMWLGDDKEIKCPICQRPL